ncbi:hypothetical protein CDL15_Pgr008898 [Punica granatum]|uniref:Non-haem dioxygenase N-terminal domain-containing protein n=1 Tax=Punica granatum TaxID=22663 RepID=A0A218VYL7_PUNGR|nr:hypothetical protein CDL15_Pgr008898 [Punica granatum]
MADSTIPTVDLFPFFGKGPSDENRQRKEEAMEVIRRACSEYGFFQIVNHGEPVELMGQTLELSRAFFECSNEEKLKSTPSSGAPLPAGYSKQPDHSPDKNEYLLMFTPGSSFNVCPKNPPELRYSLSCRRE